MTCAGCGRTNRAGAHFCGGCGRSLVSRCASCGNESAPDAQFCDACGASLVTGPAEKVEARKVVTIVFADLIGSTSLHERLDPESVSRVMERYHNTVRAPVEAHGGTVVQLLGDGVMCAFGVPRVSEDDAIRAVRAAVGIREAFRDFAREHAEVVGSVGLRVAVNTGEVVVSNDYAAGIGDPLNVAARLQQEGRDGDVLIGESTERLVRDRVTLEPFGVFQLKGRAESVAAYRLVSLERPAGVPATPFVGRDEELRRITAAFDSAVAERRARMAVVLGSPGLGKSRLIDEITRRFGESSQVLTAHCEAAGGSTFAPIAEALGGLLRVEDEAGDEARRAAVEGMLPADEAERTRIAAGIAALLGNEPAPPEETFFVIRRFLASLAAAQPVVLAIDDLQWAEPLLLDLTEHLIQWSTASPLLVLVAARPELREVRSSLAQPGGLVSDVVTLGGLDAAAATRLAANVIGAEALPAAVTGRVLATSEGNPLFVGELVRMLVHDGALKREGEQWTVAVELANLEMPPTIHALLAGRIERLAPEERTVLERAAVIGAQFSRTAVAHLLPGELRAQLDTRLEALRRSELVEPDTDWFLGEPALRFHHGLTRDAAYRRVLKATRAELHGRFAEWIESRVGEAARTPEASGGRVEHGETIGWHLEQAHQNLRELGPVDAQGRSLGERAARYLGAAGRRALTRDDLPVAASLLGRAIERLDAADPARADLALDWCEALLAAGDVSPAEKAVAELERWIGTRGEGRGMREEQGAGTPPTSSLVPRPSSLLRAWHTCFAGQLAVLTDPQALHATTTAVAAAAEELAAAGDAAGEAKAHLVRALALSRLGKVGACEAELDKALAAARRADDRRRANTVLANAPLAALWGPSAVTRASGRCLDVVRVLRITQGAPAVEAVALRCQAVLEALRGRSEAARRMIASARHMVEELGITQQLLEVDVFAGLIDLLEGDAALAEGSLRRSYEGLRDNGLGIDAARAAAFLGRALLVQGRAAEAEAVSHDSEALAGDDLQAAITWRGVRAEALASRGEHAAAVDFARAAVDLAAATDALLLHADARIALAAALRTAGGRDEAAIEEARAIELWEAKGATLLAERARRGSGRTPVEPPLPAVDRAVPARPVRRRVEANAATAHAARVCATIAARDAAALPTLVADGGEVVYHPTRSVYDMKEALRTWRSLMKAPSGTLVLEPLATLGDSLALCRHLTSATGAAGEKFDIGAYEVELIALVEADELGRRRRSEFFALDRLGDAIARLYERHAELLPDTPSPGRSGAQAGAERERAAATARTVAALHLGHLDYDAYSRAFAPHVESVDHRTLGTWSAYGKEAVLRNLRALLDLSSDLWTRDDDLLALRSDAFLLRRTIIGTDRASGGGVEGVFLGLWVFGADGLITRWEAFDVDREDEALARFDELSREAPESLPRPLSDTERGAGVPPPLVGKGARGLGFARRVRPNAATASAARADAAIAAGNVDGFLATWTDDCEAIDHPTGIVYGRRELGDTWRRAFLRAPDLVQRREELATLGERLGLFRQWVSASAASGGRFEVGDYEIGQIFLNEVDAQGRCRRSERFAVDRLGDAVVRLYERYAEILPEGPERARAAATARSVASMAGPLHLDRWAGALAPGVEFVDHRVPGTWSAHGADEVLRHLRSLLDLSDDVAARIDDILALQPSASLVRRIAFGTERAGGGAYERPYIVLEVFGGDGLLSRTELFDADRDAEALARFDELAASPPCSEPSRGTGGPPAAPAATAPTRSAAPRIANAATRFVDRAIGALDARDWERFAALYAAGFRNIDRRKLVRFEFDRDQHLEKVRQLYGLPTSRYTYEQLATRGDRLAMGRVCWMGSATNIGPSELEWLEVFEVNDRGQLVTDVQLDPDDLDAAYAELDARYDAGEAAPFVATWETQQQLLRLPALDWEKAAALLAPDFVVDDHSLLGWGALDRPAYLESVKALAALAPDSRVRTDHLWLCDRGALGIHVVLGTHEGGAFEQPRVTVSELDAQGRERRRDVYTLDQLDEARARFAEISAEGGSETFEEGPLRIPPNAATRAFERRMEVSNAGDWKALESLCAPTLVYEDRRRLIRTCGDREMFIAHCKWVGSRGAVRVARTVLATAGDSLALMHLCWTGARDGPSIEIEQLSVWEIDDQGRLAAIIVFDPDDRRAASAEMLDRFARTGEAGSIPPAAFEAYRAINDHDLDRFRATLHDDFVFDDRRRTGVGRLEGADSYVVSIRPLFDEAPDFFTDDLYHLATEKHGFLAVGRTSCTLAEGGEFESVFVRLILFHGDRLSGLEQFELEDLDGARARFEELAIATRRA